MFKEMHDGAVVEAFGEQANKYKWLVNGLTNAADNSVGVWVRPDGGAIKIKDRREQTAAYERSNTANSHIRKIIELAEENGLEVNIEQSEM